jgi:hypothetical protein
MLTARQEAFAQAIANGKSQSDAYRGAYSSSKMQEKTIWERASCIAANNKVQARIDDLKASLAKKQLWTREMSVKVLGSIAASQASKAAEKVAAVRELNAMHGFNEPARIELTGKDGGPIQLQKAHELTDDELATIAAAGRAGTADPP